MTTDSLLMWRAYLRGHAAAIRAVETELLAKHQLSLAAYEVLALLADTPRRQLRMSQLADAALLSRAGTTRLIERLERTGVLIRVTVRDDRRGVAAALTDAGLRRLHRARTTHHEVVTQYFSERLDDADLATLGRISLRLER
jgi:DNA-binding MarR family transcriptional regulator